MALIPAYSLFDKIEHIVKQLLYSFLFLGVGGANRLQVCIKNCTLYQLQQQINTLSVSTDTLDVLADMTGGSGEEEPPKRRGKHRHHRKKSGKDGFRGPEKEFQGLPEPGETQVRIYINKFMAPNSFQCFNL